MSDHSLFIYQNGGDIAYLLLYVDDIILTTSSDNLCISIMSILAKEFVMKDLGPLSFFLGIYVSCIIDSLFLSQCTYAKDIIECVGMASCKPYATPIDTKSKLSNDARDKYSNLSIASLQVLCNISLLPDQTFLTLSSKFVSTCIIPKLRI